MLSEALSKFAHLPALRVGGTNYSYKSLDRRSRSIAPLLRGPIVAILPGKTFETYAGIVAIERSGRTYVPLNPDLPDNLILRHIALAEPTSVLVDPSMLDRASHILERIDRRLTVILQEEPESPDTEFTLRNHEIKWVNEDEEPADAIDRETDTPLYQIFTSGTTGTPKKVAIPRKNVIDYLRSINSIFDFRSSDRFSHFFNLSFDLSVHDLLVTWTNGGCLVVPSQAELLDPVAFASRNDISVWFSVPSLAGLAMMTRKLRPGSLSTLRHVLFCGEALNWNVLEAFRQAAPAASLTNLYGPTEATIAITWHRLDVDGGPPAGTTNTTVPIGEPFDGQEALIVDRELKLVPDGEVGELLLGGSQLAPGYQGNSSETERCFLNVLFDGYRSGRWYRTGDLVRHTKDGMIFLGRIDSQIKWRGYRIELGEIEAVLGEIGNTPLAVVVHWRDFSDRIKEKLIGFIGESSVSAADLRQQLLDRLPRHMVPEEILMIDKTANIRNANGKIDRRKIVDLYKSHSARCIP